MEMDLQTANLIPENSSPGPDGKGTFNLLAVAPTDVWRKPPNIDNFNAPIIYHSIPISSFKSAHVTAKGEWMTLYDQGGLFLVLPPKKGGEQKRWIKSGVEFYQGKPMMSVVAADEWADWSLLSLATRGEERNGSVTVEFGVKTPIREISWAFWDVDESEELWIGMYAAKPISDARDTLAVHFEDFVVDVRTD
ncbi:Uncharacterized protein LSUB1_G004138 [Lachnellula subtilissima]|uniref:Uncharacterized protein n=1 Tax=Lachnellula subtilissima TaxID=602034 RepID=A0A8H8RLM5_9HELO|nr:Uncharacterized protein LSUB1_G004138 [Lachnellula subtilissima]